MVLYQDICDKCNVENYLITQLIFTYMLLKNKQLRTILTGRRDQSLFSEGVQWML